MRKLLLVLPLIAVLTATSVADTSDPAIRSIPPAETCALRYIPVGRNCIVTNGPTIFNAIRDYLSSLSQTDITLSSKYDDLFGKYNELLSGNIDGLKYLHAGYVAGLPYVTTNGETKVTGTYDVSIGPGAITTNSYFATKESSTGYNVRPPCAVNIAPSAAWPSYVYGDFNINIGIDNITGSMSNNASSSSYSTTIGTSARALKLHSYAYGSQISAIAGNSTIIGYGGTAMDPYSVVIGHGKRPSTSENGGYDYNFTNEAARVEWLRSYHENVFPGVHLFSKDSDEVYTITATRSEPSSQGYRYDFVITPRGEDHFAGQYDWRYGKSHGPGTFNIVTYHPRWKVSPGLKSVYINDDNLFDLVSEVAGGTVVKGPALTAAQVANGITYISNGYEEDGAIQIGKDAQGAVSTEAVESLTTKNTKIRNVGVAIGTRAKATGNSDTKNQSVAIGYCARAEGSNAIAIGGGARHLDNETDETGNNAYAKGATTVAIGYSAKAMSTSAIAVGNKAHATANNAVQIGQGTNNEPNTLKFQDVTIVKDGKLKGFDDTSLDPKQIDITESSFAEDILEIECRPHVINTVESTKNLQAGSEIGLNPTGSRNYEVFIPNTEAMRHGLPMGIYDEIEDTSIKVIYRSPREHIKLPIMFTVRQPHAKCVLITTETLDDGHDWTPNITNLNLTVKDITNPHIESTTNNWLQGYNLQGATSVSFTYPTKLSPLTTTNVVVDAAKPGEIMSHYLYSGVKSSLSVPATGMAFNGTKSWFELVYETPNGTVTNRVDVDVEL